MHLEESTAENVLHWYCVHLKTLHLGFIIVEFTSLKHSNSLHKNLRHFVRGVTLAGMVSVDGVQGVQPEGSVDVFSEREVLGISVSSVVLPVGCTLGYVVEKIVSFGWTCPINFT